jgi:hypothetical protein
VHEFSNKSKDHKIAGLQNKQMEMLKSLKPLLKSCKIEITRIQFFNASHPDIFAFAKNTPAKRPAQEQENLSEALS